MSSVLDLLRDKKKILKDMLEYVENAKFEYSESETHKYFNYTKNLLTYMKAADKIQKSIDGHGERGIKSNMEALKLDKECKALAARIYDIEKERNTKMVGVMKKIRVKYDASKNTQKFYNYIGNAGIVSESFASFDTKR